jgi:hypothetical protein
MNCSLPILQIPVLQCFGAQISNDIYHVVFFSAGNKTILETIPSIP